MAEQNLSLTRQELQGIFKSHKLVKAFEQVLNDTATIPIIKEEVTATAEEALATANNANDVAITAAADALAARSLSEQTELLVQALRSANATADRMRRQVEELQLLGLIRKR